MLFVSDIFILLPVHDSAFFSSIQGELKDYKGAIFPIAVRFFLHSYPISSVFAGLSMRGIINLSKPGEDNYPKGIDRLKTETKIGGKNDEQRKEQRDRSIERNRSGSAGGGDQK